MTSTEGGWTLRRRARGGGKQSFEAASESGGAWRISVSHADLEGQPQPVEVSVRRSDATQQPISADLMRSLPWEELLAPTARQRLKVLLYTVPGMGPDAWGQRSREAVEADESLAPLARWLAKERPARGWHEPQFWPALLHLYEQAKEQTVEPTVAVAATLDITPNAARTLIYRARKKTGQPAAVDGRDEMAAQGDTAKTNNSKEVTPPDKE
jgi:hypothetical protein